MLEFLTYIENSTDEYANQAKSTLVKAINEKVSHLKNDKSLEVEYMTLYERDKEKFQEGLEQGEMQKSIEIAKNLIKRGLDNEFILETTGLSLENVNNLRCEESN